MQTVKVETGRPYQVLIGRGLLEQAGEMAARVHAPCRLLLVSDSNVFPLYGERVTKAFEKAGFAVEPYMFLAGEASKNMGELARLLEELAQRGFDRGDMIAALGGGVCGDLAGFAAAVYQRGIPYLQIPTTLLAAVDSSVGGKTAVDLPAGKNLAGAFWQPAAVFCDCDTFDTLTQQTFADGVAESLKYGVIADSELFRQIASGGFEDRELLPSLVARCVAIKAELVKTDERDKGARQLLNFGHTPGHGIELCSGYTIPHGHAVAAGMAVMTRAAERAGICPPGSAAQLEGALERYGLPVLSPFSPEELAVAARRDKKRRGEQITLVLPERIGHCVLHSVPVEGLTRWFQMGEEEMKKQISLAPSRLCGRVAAPPSKSHAHRLLIAAALADRPTLVRLQGSSEDIATTVGCLRALGAGIEQKQDGLWVQPICHVRRGAVLHCAQSGSTLRFLLPVAAALQSEALFTGAGRLPERPLEALLACMEKSGASFSARRLPLEVKGELHAGLFRLPGDVSSQYISGLLFALPLLPEDSEIRLEGELQSAGYVEMTAGALRAFSVRVERTTYGFFIPGGQVYRSPGEVQTEGDWSGAAFFLGAGALGGPVSCTGLQRDSFQRDRQILDALARFGAEVSFEGDTARVAGGALKGIRIDMADIPDLAPILCAVAAHAQGESVLENAGRLRLKESDRLSACADMVRALGGEALLQGDDLHIWGRELCGGEVDTRADHRMVMAAAVAAAFAAGPSTLSDPESAAKSYPSFFEDYQTCGGIIL